MNFGPGELIIVVLVILLLFGAKRLPEIARSLGKAKGEFQKGLDEGDAQNKEAPDKAES
ncbi:MAG: twin-arginine translocase TatA/TatE family subunit [Actinomycetota bacterium]|nr:twin-arginine translocase TatA/TatE family subunit [Actinomycetota bacterium]